MKKLICNFLVIALGLAQTAGAADCYWAGGTSSDWATSANWTTTTRKPTNDGGFIRSDKFHDNFKSGSRAYLITFSAAETNQWRTFFNNCGSASAPIILRGDNATCGLTGGDSTKNTDLEGIYIGTYYYDGISLPIKAARPGRATPGYVSSRGRLRRATNTAISSSATIRMTAI